MAEERRVKESDLQPNEEEASVETAWVSADGSLPGDDEAPVEPLNLEDDFQDLPSFDPRFHDAFEGLVYLGHLQAEVKILNHTFTVRTLTTGEKIQVTQITQTLEQGLGYARAYKACVAAAALLDVDGQPLLAMERNINLIKQKYDYITSNWYDPVIELIYEKVNELEGQVLKVLMEMGVYGERQRAVEIPTEPVGTK